MTKASGAIVTSNRASSEAGHGSAARRATPLGAALAGLALVLCAAPLAAVAKDAVTVEALNLRQGPSTGYAVIATMPAGAKVDIEACAENWCSLTWNGYAGYASAGGLGELSRGAGPKVIAIDPPYDWRSGHYRSANVYWTMPPYAAVPPRFYPRRFILSPREHDRYRYRPHIFSPSEAAMAYGE
jgi:hypothetical protein